MKNAINKELLTDIIGDISSNQITSVGNQDTWESLFIKHDLDINQLYERLKCFKYAKLSESKIRRRKLLDDENIARIKSFMNEYYHTTIDTKDEIGNKIFHFVCKPFEFYESILSAMKTIDKDIFMLDIKEQPEFALYYFIKKVHTKYYETPGFIQLQNMIAKYNIYITP